MKTSKTIKKLISILNRRADLVILDKATRDSYTMKKKGESKFEFSELARFMKLAIEGYEFNWNCLLCFCLGEQTNDTLTNYGSGDFVLAEDDSSEFIIQINGKEFLSEIKGLKLKESNCPKCKLISSFCNN